MLVLSRKVSEQIVVGGGITITVVALRDGKVRLGIEAPQNVSIHRKEVQDKIDKEMEEHFKSTESV